MCVRCDVFKVKTTVIFFIVPYCNSYEICVLYVFDPLSMILPYLLHIDIVCDSESC